jgi:hypothetical protein
MDKSHIDARPRPLTDHLGGGAQAEGDKIEIG